MNSAFRIAVFSAIKKSRDFEQKRQRHVPGLLRLLKYAYDAAQPRGPVLTSCDSLRMYVDGQDDVIAGEILAYGAYEKQEIEFFKKQLRPGMTVIDIGANMGYYSLVAARVVGMQGHVYAFEPDPQNFSLLARNREENKLWNIEVSPFAVSNKHEKRTFFRDRHNSGGHTFCQKNLPTFEAGSLEIEAITLDYFLRDKGNPRVDWIKMDVQGAEGLVIDGAIETLKQPGIHLLMEFWPEGLMRLKSDPRVVLEKLKDLGFSIFTLTASGLDGNNSIDRILEIASQKTVINLFFEK